MIKCRSTLICQTSEICNLTVAMHILIMQSHPPHASSSICPTPSYELYGLWQNSSSKELLIELMSHQIIVQVEFIPWVSFIFEEVII
jgi:hypothetical protein